MKGVKRLSASLLFALLVSLLILPASAHHGHHGGHHGGGGTQTVVSVCPVEDCTQTGRHTHDGVTYCGYDHEDGFCDGSCCAYAQPRKHCRFR